MSLCLEYEFHWKFQQVLEKQLPRDLIPGASGESTGSFSLIVGTKKKTFSISSSTRAFSGLWFVWPELVLDVEWRQIGGLHVPAKRYLSNWITSFSSTTKRPALSTKNFIVDPCHFQTLVNLDGGTNSKEYNEKGGTGIFFFQIDEIESHRY